MDDITLDDIRKNPKEVEEYSEDEKSFIREHANELDDEEKWAFSPFLNPDTSDVTDDEESTENPQPDEDGKGEEIEEETPAEVTPPVQPDVVAFKSKEEIDAYVAKVVEERQQKAEESGEEPPKEPVKLFDDSFVPKNANEFAAEFLEKAAPLLAERQAEMTKRERDEVERINKDFDEQYTKVAQEKGLPALETPEGQEVNKQIAMLSATYGVDNYNDGYDLWSRTAKEFGGGYESAPVAPVKQDMSAQKQAASRIGKSSGEGRTKNSSQNYQDIHNTSLDSLLEKSLG